MSHDIVQDAQEAADTHEQDWQRRQIMAIEQMANTQVALCQEVTAQNKWRRKVFWIAMAVGFAVIGIAYLTGTICSD